MKEYVARFGHGTAKLARQGKSKEKLLNKKLSGGLTERPVEEKMVQFKFPDPGKLPPPVLQVNRLEFGYGDAPSLCESATVAVESPRGVGDEAQALSLSLSLALSQGTRTSTSGSTSTRASRSSARTARARARSSR